ncbi:LOW QUALITY PROTEIN: calmodulin-binding transcription activator 2-like [Limulus polyphemus]|uniref:LOW QUALITY PROTEIN: calmodulin-binding transcription activator 2-like n=1 Tax=Limulus polyphemus TaxID=6850 RepID=A0ABM1SUG2_LIMPO|nr:LOW QUALITY PROTEIN: calmodulin-binding transcription activator 2-like [Limulus polyphemus]
MTPVFEEWEKSGGVYFTTCVPMVDTDRGRPKLPFSLETIPKVDHFSCQRHRWNTNEEIAAILISFERHDDWLSKEVKIRPKSGSMLLYSRKRVRYRRDGYCWKKRRDGKTTREDHMKLKVQGAECIYGCYVHSAILPTFHRRCYWLLQNPDIVLVHYLNVPYSDDNKILISPSLSYCADKKEWTKDELIVQLRPMFYNKNELDLNNELEISQTTETIEAIVQQLMEKHQPKMTVRTHECDTTTPFNSTVARKSVTVGHKKCSHNLHQIISPKAQAAASAVSTATATTVSTVAAQTSVSKTPSPKNSDQYQSNNNNGSIFTRSHKQNEVILAAPQVPDGTPQEASTYPVCSSINTNTTSLILNLSQLQTGGGLLILNSAASAADMGLNSTSLTPITLLCGQNTSTSFITPEKSTGALDSDSMETSGPVSTLHKHMNFGNESHPIKSDMSIKSGDFDFSSSVSHEKDPNLSQALHDFTLDSDGSLALLQDLQNETSPNLFYSSSSLFSDNSSPVSIKREPINHPEVVVDLNPMDFIDNDLSTPDDEVFNLDTFYMLTDLPNLEDLHSDLEPGTEIGGSSSTTSFASSTATSVSKSNHQNSQTFQSTTQHITDYCPHWSFTEGRVKVLITGPWNSTHSSYTAMFDGISVPTTLVQNGVLRCFCPAHEAGVVTLQVNNQGLIVSNSVMFEYCQRSMINAINDEQDQFGVDESILKFSLLERMEMIEKRMSFKPQELSVHPEGIFTQDCIGKQRSFEDRLVVLCQRLLGGTWIQGSDTIVLETTFRPDLTLLHLAAALGYSRLIHTLLQWRAGNPSLILESEVDALSRDKNNCTPLLWACAKGCKEVALFLYQWNALAVKIQDDPLTFAHQRGHQELAKQIKHLEETQNSQDRKSRYSPKYLSLMEGNLESSNFDFSACPTPSEISSNTNLRTTSCSNLSLPILNPIPNVKTIRRNEQSNTCNMLLNNQSSSNENVYPRMTISDGLSKPAINKMEVCRTSFLSQIDQSLSLPLPSCPNVFTSRTGERGCISSPGLIDIDKDCNSQGLTVAKRKSISSYQQRISKYDLNMDDENNHVLSLAEKIIAAMPDHIKSSSESISGGLEGLIEIGYEEMLQTEREQLHENCSSQDKPPLELCAMNESPHSLLNEEFSFALSDHNYRCWGHSTPHSSISPNSSSLQSPSSFTIESCSSSPITADFCEFLEASGKIMDNDFSSLTLSDKEQRELYEAAKVIQKAYHSYKGHQCKEDEKEKIAAILIQSYYHKYKQYLYYKQMTRAAQVIQTQYRNYCKYKQLKKSQENQISAGSGPTNIGHYRTLNPSFHSEEGYNKCYSSNHGRAPTSIFKHTYSQRRRHQAARKIQQFMRQSKNNVSDLLSGRVITETVCLSFRKKDITGLNNRPAATAPKISGTAL